ncbi:MAG: glycoside hydrolase family 18 [Verrucomicrobiales bacterium]|nr:glycoside hydrolase family 18 [Verrucomicrobiales bacterium]
MMLPKPRFQFLAKILITLTAVLAMGLSVFGQPLVTLPPVLPTSADSSQYTPLLASSVRIQDLFGSIYFTNGPVTISQIRFQRRPGSAPFTNASVTVRIAMSTTTRAPDALNSTFSANIGADQVIVFDSAISLSSFAPASFNPATQPFDIAIPLASPFNYDPSKGNLLVDFKELPGSGIPFGVLNVSSPADKISRLTSPDGTALSGGPDTGCEPMQLVAIPASNGDIIVYPNGGGFTNSTQVSIYTKLTGGSLRYTLDGSDPSSASPLFTNSFIITDSLQVRARYYVNGFPGSDIYSAVFSKAGPILFSPGASWFTNNLQVTLTNTLGSGTIRYTLDGTAPTLSSPLYTGPIQITDSKAISAIVFLNSYPVSFVYTTNYTRVFAFDTDGISSSWRQQYFGANYPVDPHAAADADPDGDGSTNLQEFTAGTNPLDPNSGFKISVRAIPLLSWASIVDTSYNILRRPNLQSGTFTTIATIKATNTTSTFIDSDAGAGSSQYYYTIQVAP